jgi:hypothetical protein
MAPTLGEPIQKHRHIRGERARARPARLSFKKITALPVAPRANLLKVCPEAKSFSTDLFVR